MTAEIRPGRRRNHRKPERGPGTQNLFILPDGTAIHYESPAIAILLSSLSVGEDLGVTRAALAAKVYSEEINGGLKISDASIRVGSMIDRLNAHQLAETSWVIESKSRHIPHEGDRSYYYLYNEKNHDRKSADGEGMRREVGFISIDDAATRLGISRLEIARRIVSTYVYYDEGNRRLMVHVDTLKRAFPKAGF